jgi:hypothetical protein
MRALSLRALLLLAVSASSQPLAWTACRYSPAFPPTTLSLPDWAPPASRADCVPATVPGTVLHALLANGTFPFAAADPYVDTVMDQLLNESDISVLGPAFYTFTFRAALPADAVCGGGGGPPPPGARVVARVAQLSYRATLYVDGAVAGPPLLAPGGAVGNYRRWAWDLGDAGAWCAAPAAHALALLVLPPDHPGNASAACRGCGQGGNHALAQDIAPQDALGWDWVCGVPDRNTGLLDGVAVEVAPAGALVEDPAVAVADLVAPPGGAAAATSLTATITVALTALGASAIEGTLAVEVPGAGFFASAPVSLAGGARRDVALSRALRNVSLWWPHTHGAPALYDAVATFKRAGGGGAATLRFRAGFRVVASAVDAALGGRVFSVNGERVFLTGGNFRSSVSASGSLTTSASDTSSATPTQASSTTPSESPHFSRSAFSSASVSPSFASLSPLASFSLSFSPSQSFSLAPASPYHSPYTSSSPPPSLTVSKRASSSETSAASISGSASPSDASLYSG